MKIRKGGTRSQKMAYQRQRMSVFRRLWNAMLSKNAAEDGENSHGPPAACLLAFLLRQDINFWNETWKKNACVDLLTVTFSILLMCEHVFFLRKKPKSVERRTPANDNSKTGGPSNKTKPYRLVSWYSRADRPANLKYQEREKSY